MRRAVGHPSYSEQLREIALNQAPRAICAKSVPTPQLWNATEKPGIRLHACAKLLIHNVRSDALAGF
jgi:hypothetical protein